MKENFGKFLIRNLWQVKFLQIPACLLSLYMLQDIVKIITVKIGEPPVIQHIHQGFLCQKFTLYSIIRSSNHTYFVLVPHRIICRLFYSVAS